MLFTVLLIVFVAVSIFVAALIPEQPPDNTVHHESGDEEEDPAGPVLAA